MASGKPFPPTSSKKVTHPITPPCCSSTNTREWSFASSYRKEASDEAASPNHEGATGLEGGCRVCKRLSLDKSALQLIGNRLQKIAHHGPAAGLHENFRRHTGDEL